MDVALTLGIVAVGGHILASVIYNWRIFQGDLMPKSATWALWFILTALNMLTYREMTHDPAKWMPTLACAAATGVTFGLCLYWKRLKWPEPWEWFVLFMGVLAGCIWLLFRHATGANLIIVGATTLAFWPLYQGVWENPSVEKPLPWCIWTIVYGLMIAVIALRWRGWNPEQVLELVYPIAGIIMHPIVVILIFRKSRVLAPAQ